MSPGASCACHPLSCLCVLWDFLSYCTCPWSTGILWWVSSLRWLFCREKRSNSFRLLSQGRFSASWPPLCFSFGHSSLSVSFLSPGYGALVHPDRGWAEWGEDTSISASHAPADAAQDPVCLCCRISALLTLPACPPGPPDPFQQSCFQATQFQALLSSSVILDGVMWW